MNSVYATVIISEWPVCEPAPVGGARLLSWPLVACRGGAREWGPGSWRNTRAQRAVSRAAPARVVLAASHPLGCGILLRRAGCETPAPPLWRQQKNGAGKKRRGLAPKKRAPPSFCASGRLYKQKIILSSVVATSTFYARTRVRSRLHTQLFEKIVKNEKVVKRQQ